MTPHGHRNGSEPLYVPSGVATHDPAAEESIQLKDFLGVLRRNRLLIAAITVVTFGATAYLVFSQLPEYRATAVIRLADTRGAIAGGVAGAAMEQAVGTTTDPLLSQLEVLKGREVLGDVVDRLGLRLIPQSDVALHGVISDVAVALPDPADDTVTVVFGADGVRASDGTATVEAAYGMPVELPGVSFSVASRPDAEEVSFAIVPRNVAIDDLSRGLVAHPRDRTDAVEVQYTSTDPVVAQRVVNTAVAAFQAASAEAAQQQSRRRRIFLEGQLASVDSVLQEMQAALTAFRSENQVFSSREKIAGQQEGLMTLDVRLAELQADRRMYQTMLSELSRADGNRADVLRTLVSAPGVASNAVVAQLYGQLVQYETARDSLLTGTLGATADHPDAQRLAVLIDGTQTKLVDAIWSHVASLDARIAALGGLREQSAGEIAALPSTEAQEVDLVQQVETTRRMGDELRSELQRARISEAVEAGQVELVNEAPLPRTPISGQKPLQLGLGLVLGLLLGSGAAFVREHLNTTIRRREEVESVLRVPGLAVIPRIAVSDRGRKLAVPVRIALGNGNGRSRSAGEGRRELVAVSDDHSSSAEAFRMLRTNLLFSQAVDSLRTIAVTSATPGEGKTTTAANLAATFAQQGKRVVLVDCDLRRARLHRMMGVEMTPGLSELVLGHGGSRESIRTTEVEGLSFLPAGTLPPNPAELLGGARMSRALDILAESFDLVILDTPPLLAAADAAILGARVDGVLLVVRAGRTERGQAQFAMQQLQGVGARVLGVVLNDPDAQVPLYGGYYYYDYYGPAATVS